MFTVTDHETHLDIVFHSPQTSNALSLVHARELAAIQKRYSKPRKPVVVRSGHPTVFCSGGNLRDHARLATKAEGLRANREIARILDAFGKWPAIKLAVVEGRVLGGGVEWLGRFDFRWGTDEAEITFKQKRVGLGFGWGGGLAWSRWLGEARVRQLLLEARPLDAAEAHRLGVIDRRVKAEDVSEAVLRWAREIRSPIDATLVGWSIRREAKIFAKLWWGEAHRAVLAKWLKAPSKS